MITKGSGTTSTEEIQNGICNLQSEIHKLMEYTDSTADVSDPWYTRDFDRCYNDIRKGCEALLNSLI